MSVARCRAEVANAEALFTTHLTTTHNRLHGLIGEVRAAATPLRVGVAAVVTAGALYVIRPTFGTLLKVPVMFGAVSSVVQHFSHRMGDDLLFDTDQV